MERALADFCGCKVLAGDLCCGLVLHITDRMKVARYGKYRITEYLPIMEAEDS